MDHMICNIKKLPKTKYLWIEQLPYSYISLNVLFASLELTDKPEYHLKKLCWFNDIIKILIFPVLDVVDTLCSASLFI